MKLTRRKFVAGLGGLGAMAGGGLAYMRFGESDWFEQTVTSCQTGRTAADLPLRVLRLSDLHASDVVPLEMIARAVKLGVEMNPDLIVMTGDFWTTKYHRINAYADVLRPLSDVAPTFAAVGNHDGGRWAESASGWATLDPLRELLARARVSLLWNESHALEIGSRKVTLLGVGDWWAGDCAPFRTFNSARERGTNELRLVLNHNPDAKDDFADYDWDVMCCGHTHGGQLRIPLIGRTPFAPVRDHDFVAGLNPWRGRQIFTTRGVGNLHGMRFNCRPEISLLLVS
ncbi:phosphodiesterase YaeI [Opitutaceae bacterium]|nr:phosphodiesterase YaeI [Opitutaceae bacterium]